MTTQEILTRVNDAIRPYKAIIEAQDSRDVNPWAVAGEMHERLLAIQADLEAKLRYEIANKAGNLDATRTITAMLKASKKDNTREALHYAWVDKHGNQCVCDGFRAFRLVDHLELEPRPDNAAEPIDLDGIFPVIRGAEWAKTELPSIDEVRTFIALKRTEWTGKRKDFSCVWDFGPGKPAVNAQYLLDLLVVLPDATELFYRPGKGLVGVMLTRGERGEAVLLPVRTTRLMADYNKAVADEEAAEQAIKAQAEAEGRDPAYIRERQERIAKRKAAAKKALDDNLAHIRMEMALSENYALELDEFEYLVFLMDEVAKVA